MAALDVDGVHTPTTAQFTHPGDSVAVTGTAWWNQQAMQYGVLAAGPANGGQRFLAGGATPVTQARAAGGITADILRDHGMAWRLATQYVYEYLASRAMQDWLTAVVRRAEVIAATRNGAHDLIGADTGPTYFDDTQQVGDADHWIFGVGNANMLPANWGAAQPDAQAAGAPVGAVDTLNQNMYRTAALAAVVINDAPAAIAAMQTWVATWRRAENMGYDESAMLPLRKLIPLYDKLLCGMQLDYVIDTFQWACTNTDSARWRTGGGGVGYEPRLAQHVDAATSQAALRKDLFAQRKIIAEEVLALVRHIRDLTRSIGEQHYTHGNRRSLRTYADPARPSAALRI